MTGLGDLADEPDMKCTEALDNLVAYVQEELGDERAVREMQAHLAACEICRREEADVRKTLQMVRETYHEFVPSDRAWKMLLERLRSLRAQVAEGALSEAKGSYEPTQAPAGPKTEARRAPAMPRKRRLVAAAISVAAVAAIVAGIWLVLSLTGFKLVLEKGDGVTALVSADNWSAIKPGQRVEDGWSVKTAGPTALFRYGDGSTLELQGGAEMGVVGESGIRLENGALTADVRPSGSEFVVSTAFGEIRANKARFTVEVSTEKMLTTVRVFEGGSVVFANDAGQEIVAPGEWSRATRHLAPMRPHAESASGPPISPDTVQIVLKVFDGQNFVAGDEQRLVALKADEPLVVRFEVKNIWDREIAVPTGRTGDLNILLWLPLPRDITTAGRMVGDEPATSEDAKTVSLAPGQVFRFDYSISPDVTKFQKGGRYTIFGKYCFVGSQSITVEVK
jgi:ferric-dicitrate binding protein FerR (iron transport regulator)